MTLEEYAKSNYRFLDKYQAELFISNGAKLEGCYVSYNVKKDKYSMIYVFEKNEFNEELLNKYHRYQLTWGKNVMVFE